MLYDPHPIVRRVVHFRCPVQRLSHFCGEFLTRCETYLICEVFDQPFCELASGGDLGLLWSEVLNANPVQTTGRRLVLLLYKVSESVLILEFSDFLDLTRIVENHVRKPTIFILCHVLFFGGRFVARLRARPEIVVCVL